jgi:hypothetical protein
VPRRGDQHRFTFDELLPEVRAYYQVHPAGGSLHITLDDGNVDRRHVWFCWCKAVAAGDHAGAALAMKLLHASRRTRERLHHGH